MSCFFKAIPLPSDKPVQYVGCYVLRWGKVSQPTIGFITANMSEHKLVKAIVSMIYLWLRDTGTLGDWDEHRVTEYLGEHLASAMSDSEVIFSDPALESIALRIIESYIFDASVKGEQA